MEINLLGFAYSSGHRLLILVTGNRLKTKTTAKLKGKQTLIATVRNLLQTFATFPTHLLSQYRLPPIVHFSIKVLDLFFKALSLFFGLFSTYVQNIFI
jgi:hypothetical protein